MLGKYAAAAALSLPLLWLLSTTQGVPLPPRWDPLGGEETTKRFTVSLPSSALDRGLFGAAILLGSKEVPLLNSVGRVKVPIKMEGGENWGGRRGMAFFDDVGS